MIDWNLIKCAFGFHQYNRWHRPKGTFKSGIQYLYYRTCHCCSNNDQRWLTILEAEGDCR